MSQTDTSNRWGGFIEMQSQHVVQIALLGVILGIAGWVVSMFVRQVLFVPLFCGDPTSSLCIASPESSVNVAAIIVSIGGLLGLIRLSVYRPLLIVIASLVCLWGFGGLTTGLSWYETVAWSIILYTLCYVTFAWLVRPRALVPASIIVLVVVVLVRTIPLL